MVRIASFALCASAVIGMVACGGGGDSDAVDADTAHQGGVPQSNGADGVKGKLGQGAGVPTRARSMDAVNGQGAGVPTSAVYDGMATNGQGAGVPTSAMDGYEVPSGQGDAVPTSAPDGHEETNGQGAGVPG